MGRRTFINLVFFLFVFGVLLYWAVGNIVTLDAVERPYELHATFEQAAGVRADSEVTYLGVHHGRVGEVQRVDGGVEVTMKIDRDKEIPAGSIARIFRKSAIGEPYIDFTPPDDFDRDGEMYAAGTEIPLEDTTIPLEFDALLRSASDLIDGIDPDDARVVIHELATALDGRGESLRTLTEAADELTASFVTKTDELDRLATNNTRLTRIFAEHRDSLGDSITNLRELADTLRRSEGDLAVVLDDGSRLLGMAADLVADEKANLDCILKNVEDVIDLASSPDQLDGLETLLTDGPTAFGYVWSTRDDDPDGLWIRVALVLDPTNPAQQYVPERALPAVPAVPACSSSIGRSTGPRFQTTPGGAVVPADGVQLPATGSSPLGLLALCLLAGAVATWRMRWRTGE